LNKRVRSDLSLDAEYRINNEYRLVKVEDWNEQSNNVRRYVTY